MPGTGSRAVARGSLLLALCLSLLSTGGVRAEEGGEKSPPSSLAAFDDLYARLMSPPEGGHPAPDVATAAEALRFDLRTDLIRDEAEIEVLKLEVARFAGERQRLALDRLVDAAAARERRLWLAIRQLEGLAGAPAVAPPAMVAADEADEKKGGLQVFAEANDPTEDPDP